MPTGNVVATDELIEIDLPDGTVIIDETFSVADEDGELVAIDEDTTVLTPEDDDDEERRQRRPTPRPTAEPAAAESRRRRRAEAADAPSGHGSPARRR